MSEEKEEEERKTHLTTLIYRVEKVEERLSKHYDDLEKEKNTIAAELADPLSNLGEYMQVWEKGVNYTEDEMQKALDILERYGIEYGDMDQRMVFRRLANGMDDLDDNHFNYGYRENCVVCGRSLEVEESKKRGIGPVCLRKQKRQSREVIDEEEFWNEVERQMDEE